MKVHVIEHAGTRWLSDIDADIQTVRRVRLRAALAEGLTVRATGLSSRRVRLVARRGRTIVARGAARAMRALRSRA